MRTLALGLFAIACLPLSSCTTQAHSAQPAHSPRREYHIGSWEQDIGYSQAIRIGNTLHVSGSAGGGEMPNAIREAYGTLEKTLRDHGLSFANVVKETVYTTDIEALKKNQDQRKKYYGTTLPAATWVQISRLYDAGHVIEVEVTAVFPD